MAFLGLLAAGQVQADERCGLRSDAVLTVQRWNVEQVAKPGKYELQVYLDSLDPKPIKNISGRIEFFAGRDHILSLPLTFPYPIQLGSHFVVNFNKKKLPNPILAGAPDVVALACVASVSYTDGSGVIIN
ncbi:MAG: hypothetical protein JWL86_1987 [Rhizobium sp.]|nr:hypothetical protein [Rhizobium sp.]